MFNFFNKNTKKKVFIFLGNEDKEGFCGELADAYEKGAKAGGHEVRRVNIGDLKFDPLLHKGYKVIQELEPDLKMVQENIRWAEHVVIIYPTWWSGMPAILKGFFDRAWLPGFGFHMHKSGMWWDALLKGRTGRVIITMDGWALGERILFGDSTNEIGRAIMNFAGIKTKIEKIGDLKHATPEHRQEIKESVYDLGVRAK
jgi:putative NADPH-quinone reductase